MRRKQFAVLCCVIAAVGVQSAVGQKVTQQAQTPASPAAAANTPSPAALPQAPPMIPPAIIANQVLINFSVLETDPDLDITFETAKAGESGDSDGVIELLSTKSHDEFVRSLVEAKAAKVLSRPKIITLNGQAAQVQVGQEVTLALPGMPEKKATVGLKLSCRPIISGDKLRIELDCENSTLGNDQRIHVSSVETVVSVDWGHTVVLRGLGKDLVLLVTPHQVRKESVGDLPVYPSPAVPGAIPAQSATLDRIAEIQSVFRSVDSAMVKGIELSNDRIMIEATLSKGQQGTLPSLLQKIAKVANLKVTAVSTSLSDSGIKLEIKCELPSAQKARSKGPFDDLGLAIKALFPDEAIELAILPNAVVLRGEVEEQTASKVVDIAMQYYPTVINHLEGRRVSVTPRDVRSQPLSEQLDGLSTELRSLRAEVRRLIGTLKSKPATEESLPWPVSHVAPKSREAANPYLGEVLSIAKQNNRADVAPKRAQVSGGRKENANFSSASPHVSGDEARLGKPTRLKSSEGTVRMLTPGRNLLGKEEEEALVPTR